MSLNPVQFGEDVIEQYTRYLLTYFPIADHRIEEQVAEALRKSPTGERMLVKGPYIHLNPAFEEGPPLRDLLADPQLGLHPALAGVFSGIETLHKHQELAVRAIGRGKHTVVASGTGSGKTEAFLLPIVDHCLKLRDQGAPAGVVAVLVYPMNALVNDQLERLRLMLAGTRITFARYTGETQQSKGQNVAQLKQPRAYTENELEDYREGRHDLPLPWEESYGRDEIQERRPRLLLTNYNQLEYLLLRGRDLDLFADAPLRYLVFDEVHTYTGGLGSEVACLIRRLRHVAGKRPDELVCIGTSATVQDPEGKIDGREAVRNFAHRLFGVGKDSIEIVEEQFRRPAVPARALYDPRIPDDAEALLTEVLGASREVQLREEPGELPGEVVAVAERLCGRPAPAGETNHERLYDLLANNSIVMHLSRTQQQARLLDDALNALRAIGVRRDLPREALVAELLCYLTLGAIAQRDEEPLLRPKLHYFVQGYRGMWVSFEPEDAHAGVPSGLRPVVHFDDSAAREAGGDGLRMPLLLCRGCGQHYFRVYCGEAMAADEQGAEAGYLPAVVGEEPGEDEEAGNVCYLTDSLHTEDEEREEPEAEYYMCRYCGALHKQQHEKCLNDKCGRYGPMVPVRAFQGELTRCAACGAPNSRQSPTISGTRSAVVQDVMILVQTMLAAMAEPALRKVLVFTDNRQEAAFQAGWMEERSKRLRLRHLLYRVLAENPERAWGVAQITDRLVELGQEEGILPVVPFEDERSRKRVKWFVLQEFASMRERRGSLETLGLARVSYVGLEADADPAFFGKWAGVFGVKPEQVVDVARLILDYYRRRGALSDELLRHWWGYSDPQVRDGIIQVHERWSPTALSREKSGKGAITRSFLARTGTSSAQGIVRKAFANGEKHGDEFLSELWDWLTDGARGYLVPVQITTRDRGRLKKLDVGQAFQVNVEKVGLEHTQTRQVCEVCRRAQAVPLPSRACPEYRCRGVTSEQPSDQEHFAVVLYTQWPFVPLLPAEHTAQVDKEKRQAIEREFKRQDGRYNCIVCTPTLELGVDIGRLEMAVMRNVPPTPANYAQRAGRAGRRHRIAVVFTYCSDSQHDRYFFANPPEIISGAIRVPGFSMRNAPLVRKHAHSAVLTLLRRSADETASEVLGATFPAYVWHYFLRKWERDEQTMVEYIETPPSFPTFRTLVQENAARAVGELREAFTATWPEEDREVVTEDALSEYVTKMPDRLEAHVGSLYQQAQAYRKRIQELSRREADSTVALTPAEERERQRHKAALAELQEENQSNYTLSYLSADGFLPGYAMARESCVARCLDPYKELSRPAAVALREFTPASWVYADGLIFQPHRVDFHRVLPGDTEQARALAQRELEMNEATGAVTDVIAREVEGGEGVASLRSLLLGGVELRRAQRIDDTRDSRRYTGYDIRGTMLRQHSGGWHGSVGDRACSYYRNCRLLLVNVGPVGAGRGGRPVGFPVCPVCGATRRPSASEADLDEFRKSHAERCKITGQLWFALHVEISSDVLQVGPFPNEAEAVNAMEGLMLGIGQVLDTGTSELDGFLLPSATDAYHFVLYDPVPGGSGLLPQLCNYWAIVCERAVHALENCPGQCDAACYGCLKNYRNQHHHALLNRWQAAHLVSALAQDPVHEHEIPPETGTDRTPDSDPESDAEALFLDELRERRFPVPPEAHYAVDLGDGAQTIPDYAYPEKRVAVYINGMSAPLHGDPKQRAQDQIRRAKLQARGWRAVTIPASALHDDAALAVHLNELAIYLGRDDLLSE